MADDVGLITGFKLVSGEEIIFQGIRSGAFGEIFKIPAAVKIGAADEWNMFGHLIGNPFLLIPPAPHMGDAWRLEPWPRMRRKGTCEELFVKDRDVMYQMMTVEIDEDILTLYHKVLADQRWVDPYGR